MSSDDERHSRAVQTVDFAEPNYYASGVNVLAPKTAHLCLWQQLKDKPVCSVEGAAYLGQIKDRYGPDLHSYKNTDQVYAAAKAGECYAAYDDRALVGQLQTRGWASTKCRCARCCSSPGARR